MQNITELIHTRTENEVLEWLTSMEIRMKKNREEVEEALRIVKEELKEKQDADRRNNKK